MWFELALVSMFAYGVLDFLFKVAEARRVDFSNLLLYYYWSAALIAFSLFIVMPANIPNFSFIALFAAAQVSFYLLANVFKLESLKHVKSVLAYPIFSLHGVVVAVLAFFFLGESLSLMHYVGIALSVAAILLLIERGKHIRFSRGALLAIGAMLCLAISATITAAVVDKLVLLPFIGMSYFFAIGPSYVLEKRLHARRGTTENIAPLGVAMGVANVTAFYCLLLALQNGPASIVLPVSSLALLVSVILSILVYKERLSKAKAFAILLALVAIVVMKL